MHLIRRILIAVALLAGVPALAMDGASDTKVITVGTGAVTGVYYPAGGAICRLMNMDRKEHGIRCLVESTGGSMYNLNALRDGELDFATVQSDWQDGAYRGTGVFADGPPFKELRSVFSLHSEMFTLAARKNSGIKKLSDLKGKRVNVGDPGSGMRATMQALMEEFHWTKHSFAAASELRPMEAAQALCAGTIDAMVFTAGHPNGLVQEITGNCGAQLIPVTGKEVDAVLNERPYYARTVIPGKMYKGVVEAVPTFGVKATLVTTAKEDEQVVYELTKAVFEEFDTFRTLHFVFATLDPKRMVSAGLSAPLHPGAERYFRERGLLEQPAESNATESK
jgi:hypothetical protein